MKKVAVGLGINKNVTTYFARHSFATILKNSGISTEFTSEAWDIVRYPQPKIIWQDLKKALLKEIWMCWFLS